MESNILKIKNIIGIFFILMLFMCCNRKSSQENQITIKITLINKDTRQPRTNSFDTIEVRKEGIGFLTKTFKKVAEYVTDSTGSIKIKIKRNEGYKFMLSRRGFYGAENFSEAYTKEKLKDGQEVNIEVFSIENR
jgi:hypothetical protein